MQEQHTRPNDQNLPAQSIMLTVDGVATLLACSPRTVYRLVDKGRIPRPARIGGLIRWPREVLERWIAEGCPVPTVANVRPRTGPQNSPRPVPESP